MNSVALKKDFERQKAISKIILIAMLLSIPSVFASAQGRFASVVIFAFFCVVAALYAHIRRLNFKLNRLSR